MGGSGSFLESGGFSRQEYMKSGDPIAGIKVIKHITDPNKGLPQFCNTHNTVYLRENEEGAITQLRVYNGREPYLDVDWGHNHGKYKKGTAHVQEWHKMPNGSLIRDRDARDLTSSEIKRFEKVFKALDVKVEIPK